MANAVYYAFDFVFFNHFDPALMDVEKDLAIEMYRSNTPINEQFEMEQGIRNAVGHTVGSNALQFARWSILGFGVAFGVAYLVKKNNNKG